jgi:hypothetical protein
MKPELPSLAIARPCSANWDEMRGDDKRRFCEHCQKYVHNISAMPKKERMAFARSNQQQCIFYFQRPDGNIAKLSFLAFLRRRFPIFRIACWSTLIALLPVTLGGCMGARCPREGELIKLDQAPQPSASTTNPAVPKDTQP